MWTGKRQRVLDCLPEMDTGSQFQVRHFSLSSQYQLYTEINIYIQKGTLFGTPLFYNLTYRNYINLFIPTDILLLYINNHVLLYILLL